MIEHPLTGRTRHRAQSYPSGTVLLVLQVQYVKRTAAPEGQNFDKVQLLWRDARVEDLATLATYRLPNLNINVETPSEQESEPELPMAPPKPGAKH